MPRGGLRPKLSDGSTDHLLKPKWLSGQTQTIRVPIVLADEVLELAHRLDSGNSIDLTQDNDELDKEVNSLHARNGDLALELDNCREMLRQAQEQPKESGSALQPARAIALLKEAIALKANAGGAIKIKIKEAIALLEAES